MRTVGRWTRFLLVPVCVTAAVAVAWGQQGGADDKTADEPPSSAKGAGVGHKEVPVPAPEVPVSREDQPTSYRGVITRGLHESIQVNVDAAQNNIVGDAANEPSMAIDPTNPDNIVIGWRQFDSISSDFRQAGYAYSHDGGRTWTFPGVLEPGQFRSDPVLAADSAGTFFYYSLSTTTNAEMFISYDKGLNWDGPIDALGGDKTWMAADIAGGIGDGNVYTLWNSQFTCCAPGTDFTRSTDGGLTYDGPYAMPQHPKWGTLAVGPGGEVYVTGATLAATSHLILRSSNAEDPGQTPSFELAQQIDLGGTSTTGNTPNPGGLMGQVWVDVDRSGGPTRGNVYVLGSVNPPGADPLDVHFIRSTDGGQTWTAPVRVNDDASTGAFQWFGTMSVAPDGRIDAAWNDTRSDPSGVISELYYAYSTDRRVERYAKRSVGCHLGAVLRVLDGRGRHLVRGTSREPGLRLDRGLSAAEQDRRLLPHGLGCGRGSGGLLRHVQRRRGRLLPAGGRLQCQRAARFGGRGEHDQ